MPPSNKRKITASVTDKSASGASVAVLLARCPRSTLEAILAEAVTSGEPVTYDSIKQALPESKQAKIIARPVVAGGQTREGTGLFDYLDDEVLVAIFSHVASTATLLNCAIAVRHI